MPRSKPWLKMWVEWLDDPKMLRMTLAEQDSWWRLVSLAQRCNADGSLSTSGGSPLSTSEIAACLHITSPDDVAAFNSMLKKMESEGSLCWNNKTLHIIHFVERQEMVTSETPEALRERQRVRRQKLWETYGIKDSKIPLEIRQFVIDRDECRCQLCGKQGTSPSPDAAIVLDPEDNSPFEFDHIIPRTQGGPDTPENLRLACRKCNRARRNLPSVKEVTQEKREPEKRILEGEGEEEGEQSRDNFRDTRDKPVTSLSLSQKISDKPKRQVYGEGKNVLLSEEDLAKLEAAFGKQSAQERIEALSLYKGSTGKKYASDYLTILNWDRMAKKKGDGDGRHARPLGRTQTHQGISPTYHRTTDEERRRAISP